VDGSGVELLKNNLQNIQHNTLKAGRIAESGIRNSKSDIKKVAREMESLFIYELMKVMRKTTETMSSDNKGLGNETYTGIFDQEISKVMSEKGIGIQDAIVNWLDRRPQNKENDNDNKK
jgi:Rod binding domain-containing protein